MIHCIINAECLSKDKDWVNLDAVWFSPIILNEFINLLTKYLLNYKESLKNTESEFTKLVLPDKVYGAFGAIPLFLPCCIRAEIPFIIWKEWAEPATGRSKIYGKILSDDRLLIAHDVINYGATPVKIIDDLSLLSKEIGFQVTGVLTIVDRQNKGLEFVEKQTCKPVKAIVLWTDLIKEADNMGK